MLYSPDRKKNTSLAHLTLKGETFFAGLKAMGYDLFVPGELDLKVGIGTLDALCRVVGIEAVQLNLYRQGERIFKGSKKIRKSGVDILVTGVIAEEFIKDEYRTWSGIEAREPREELENLWKERGGEADLFVIVSHMPERKERLLARSLATPAVFLSAHAGPRGNPVVEGKSVILSLPDRGRYVGKVTLRAKAGANAPSPAYSLPPESRDVDMVSRDKEAGVRFERLSLDEGVAGEEKMEALLSAYREKIRSLRHDFPGDGGYRGFSYCRDCHAERSRRWLSRAHSRAFGTLAARGEEMNPDCLVCHTTGFGEGGYRPLGDKRSELEGVGCEECHGPGEGHPGKELTVPGEKDCRRCHNRGEEWDFADARRKIGCEGK
ncbi:MAG: hypothetical protein GTN70_09115 [Deltaproteobacteria bacterium]|nr:hypothetical protein [Deltaproteobacteria bacterium]NIS77938.1 hypothetical protein [Deltaproteobacteria bacterium]